MGYFKIFIALIMSFVMFLSNGVTALFSGTPAEPKSEAELLSMADIFEKYELSDEIYVVNGGVSADERAAIQSLQGLVARDKATIFINYGMDSKTELAFLENAGHKLIRTDENGANWTLKNLVPRFSSYITDNSYVLFTSTETTEQINMAFNYATVYGCLAIPESCEETAKALGLKKAYDLTEKEITVNDQDAFYEEHKALFRTDALVHQNYMVSGLRDFAVQQNIFITYAMDSDYVERTFRDKVLSELEPSSIVFGWCQYEVKFTESVSSFGHFVIPSDHCFNMTILNACEPQQISEKKEVKAPELDPAKHYIAIVYSDGDNAQWISNGFQEFHTWQSYGIDTPITWTFAPLMNEFSPVAVKKATDNMGNCSFITGPSGAGYARVSKMSAEKLEAYSEFTAATMLASGLTTMTLLDEPLSLPGFLWENKLSYFARYDNINGGILQIDPTRYAGGEGKVFFVDDKPFVSVRLSLWYPSGNADEVTNEWLKEQAEIVNNYSADINSISGYSVINVHPWTVGPDDLAYFVSQLDDGVEVISADELIAAVTANVPHKTAKP